VDHSMPYSEFLVKFANLKTKFKERPKPQDKWWRLPTLTSQLIAQIEKLGYSETSYYTHSVEIDDRFLQVEANLKLIEGNGVALDLSKMDWGQFVGEISILIRRFDGFDEYSEANLRLAENLINMLEIHFGSPTRFITYTQQNELAIEMGGYAGQLMDITHKLLNRIEKLKQTVTI
jgi:hypothetical protein